MEKPCYKCGAVVEEGRPFCPHCGAPLIRVIVAEPVAAIPGLVSAGAASEDSSELSSSQTVPVLALPFGWSQALKPCSLAALVSVGLMMLGLHPFVAMLSVGFLSVVFYRQNQRGLSIRRITGAGIGALGGLLWFAMTSVLEVLTIVVTNKGAEVQAALLAKLDQAAKQSTDPQVLALFDKMKSPGGLELLMISGIVFAFVASIVLAALTGAIGASLLGRRKP